MKRIKQQTVGSMKIKNKVLTFAFGGSLLLFAACDRTANVANSNANQQNITVTSTQSAPAKNAVQGNEKINANTASNATVPSTAALTPVPLPDGTLSATAEAIDGSTLKLEDYKGRVVVLDIWATWCGPCRLEIPHLVEMQKEFQPQGVEVIGLTTENPNEAAEDVREFINQYGINYKIGWAGGAHKNLVRIGGGVIPQTFVLDRQGRVVRHLRGFHPEKSPPVLRQAVEQALAQS